MGNQYSAQNVAAYLIYEFNDYNYFINGKILQELLYEVEMKWQNVFGHSAYYEQVAKVQKTGYAVKEVYEKYADLNDEHIEIPAKDWYLKYGEFQLVYRTYGIPPFTSFEEKLVQEIIEAYKHKTLKSVS